LDGRNKRRERTAAKCRLALARLRDGLGTHPRHIGIKVRITKEAVAREARIAPSTLYRLPEVCAEIAASEKVSTLQAASPAEQRRRAFLDTIRSLEEKNAALLAESLRLTRALAKFDPTLGIGSVPSLDQHRAKPQASRRRHLRNG
jgi:hypothetical protein